VKACELQFHHHIYGRRFRRDVRQNARRIVRQRLLNQQRNFEYMTRAIKAFERAKRATTYQNDRRNKFNQIRREQKFVRVMHRD
jgi:hypothetical protein